MCIRDRRKGNLRGRKRRRASNIGSRRAVGGEVRETRTLSTRQGSSIETNGNPKTKHGFNDAPPRRSPYSSYPSPSYFFGAHGLGLKRRYCNDQTGGSLLVLSRLLCESRDVTRARQRERARSYRESSRAHTAPRRSTLAFSEKSFLTAGTLVRALSPGG